MKKKTKIRIARVLTNLVKPCVFYQETETPKGLKLKCNYDGSYRNRCRTVTSGRHCATGSPGVSEW